ncbi:MAG: DUF433 domain-containing protein [Candidatus Hydrogenedens sp.]|nr:DUF433 domain-containing protein [Candidatus Hydrogenedens sp.]
MNTTCYIAPTLGVGTYAIPEAARYLGTNSQTLRNWFVPSDREPAFHSDFEQRKGATAISFHDLIDAQVAVQLKQMDLSLQRIRKVYHAMQENFGLRHPFCSSRLFTDGNEVFLHSAGAAGDDSFVEVLKLQHYFTEILKPFLRHVDYDEAVGLARRWHIHTNVVIDPNVYFGKPVVEGSRISTQILAREYLANHQDAEYVATLFDISEQQVLSAFAFERDVNQLKVA